jgi:hypothetical protein
VNHSRRGLDVKIVDQASIAADRLSPNPAPARCDVVHSQRGDQLLKRGEKASPAQRAKRFSQSISPLHTSHSPESGEGSKVGHVSQRNVHSRVAFPLESEHRIWPSFDDVVDASREMNAEKWKRRIGDGINQPANERRALRAQRVVLAAEGDNSNPGLDTR